MSIAGKVTWCARQARACAPATRTRKAKVNNSTGWQYVFYLLAGLGATTALAAFFAIAPDTALKDDKRNVDTRIDMFGGCLISAAICLFTYSLTDSGIAERGWAEPRMS